MWPWQRVLLGPEVAFSLLLNAANYLLLKLCVDVP